LYFAPAASPTVAYFLLFEASISLYPREQTMEFSVGSENEAWASLATLPCLEVVPSDRQCRFISIVTGKLRRGSTKASNCGNTAGIVDPDQVLFCISWVNTCRAWFGMPFWKIVVGQRYRAA